MENDNPHEMIVWETYPTGAQEWYCPTCGRRYVIQWPPAYSKVILEAGDEMAIHVGATGEPQMDQPESPKNMSTDEDEGNYRAGETDNLDDPYLSPYTDFLNGLNL